jgi:chromate transporter
MTDPSLTSGPTDAIDPPDAPGGPLPSRMRQVLEVFVAFLVLGLSAFGGPVAHLAYFRTEFVERRRWLDDQRYADLVALCQFLPGPASSQVGMALGLARAGWPGALAAWTGFTLPSALAMILFAQAVGAWSWLATSGAVHGLKLATVAVVAHALLGMAKSLCPDRDRAAIAIGAALIALLAPGSAGQVAAIMLGGVAGRLALKLPPATLGPDLRSGGVRRGVGMALLVVWIGLLLVLPLAATTLGSPWLSAASVFYQAGSLVFGGGHVVLPLLQAGVVPAGWVGDDVFLAGYGAAQAVPGPLFTFAAYLGAAMSPPLGGWAGGLAMLIAIFLPAFLLVAGALPFWDALRARPDVRSTMAGLNASVVGLLIAAFYDPVWTAAVHSRWDAALALAAYGLLAHARLSPVLVVGLAAGVGALAGLAVPSR